MTLTNLNCTQTYLHIQADCISFLLGLLWCRIDGQYQKWLKCVVVETIYCKITSAENRSDVNIESATWRSKMLRIKYHVNTKAILARSSDESLVQVTWGRDLSASQSASPIHDLEQLPSPESTAAQKLPICSKHGLLCYHGIFPSGATYCI